MEILHQYCYHQGKVVAKAVAYVFLSLLLVGLGVFCHVRWELSFFFSDWKGWLIIVVYGLVTLGTILSAIDLFRKIGKARRSIPAFALGEDCFVTYDHHGLATAIPFERCEEVRVKRTYHYRGSLPTLTLIIRYRDKADPTVTTTVEFNLSELDRPQHEISKHLKASSIKSLS